MNSTKDENMEKQEEKVTKQEEVNNHEEQSETPASEKTTEESKELSPEEKLQQSLDEAENASQRFRTNTSVCQLNLTITASAP